MAEIPPVERSDRWGRWAAWLTAVAVTLPGPAASLESSVDGSWRWAINQLPSGPIRFGDVVYSYGPLGFVMLPTYAGGKAVSALLAQWLLHALLAVALYRFMRPGGLARAWLAAAAIALSHWTGMVYEGQLALGMILLLAPTALGESRARWPVVVTGTMGGLALLAKLSLGVTALGVIAALALATDHARHRLAGLGLAASAGALSVAGAWAFRSPERAARWWSGSREIALGFAEGMTVAGDEHRLPTIGGLALFVLVAVWLTARDSPVRGLAWMCAPAVYLAYAHAATRLDDSHARLFGPFLLAVCGLLAASATRLEARVCAAAALAVTAVLAPQIGAGSQRGRLAALARDFTRRIEALASPSEAAASAARRSGEALAPLRFAAPWADTWRRSMATVDALPFRLSYVAANDWPWRPNPTLQLYAAMTGELDGRGAAHFCGSAAPEHLLVRFEDIDDRNMVWDTPLSWRAIAACWEPDAAVGEAAGAGERRVRALRRRAVPGKWEWRPLGETVAPAGEWVAVPDDGGVVFGELEVERSALGRLAGLLLPAPPLWVEVELPSGGSERWRIVRRTAVGGLQLAPVPGQLRHLNAWWSGMPFAERRARRVRWLVEGAGWRYADRATIRFRGGRLAPLTPPAAPRSDAGAAP